LFSAVPGASRSFFMFRGSRFHVLWFRNCIRRCRVCQVSLSCFALLDPFSAVSSESGPFLMFYAPGLVFGGTEGVESRFHVLCARNRFRRYLGRRVPLTSFALPDSFSAVPSASGPVFMFCAPELVFDCTEGVGSCFHVLRARTGFRRY
jgi:hypothetical protein